MTIVNGKQKGCNCANRAAQPTCRNIRRPSFLGFRSPIGWFLTIIRRHAAGRQALAGQETLLAGLHDESKYR